VGGFGGGFVSRFTSNVRRRIVDGFVWSLEGIFSSFMKDLQVVSEAAS
jgi:hypothetical protein